jgi:hypothetical protein
MIRNPNTAAFARLWRAREIQSKFEAPNYQAEQAVFDFVLG